MEKINGMEGFNLIREVESRESRTAENIMNGAQKERQRILEDHLRKAHQGL